MKAGLRNPLSWLLRAGFLTRLSNLIIIQGLFVFAAVALLVFFPQSEKTDPSDITHYSAELESARKEIASVLPTSDASASRREQADPLQAMLQSLFRRLPDLGEIQIFTTHSDQGLIPIVKSKNPGMEHDRRIEHQELDNLIDPAILRTCLQNPDQRPLTSLEPAQHLVSYHPFQFDTGIPAVLVALTKHDLVISHRSQLKYALFVLFLCSTLISLLTIYLIANRFKGPLDRLIQGFEKTAAGELFFIFEARGDAELRQLAAAFNTMSQKLWQNHKRLKESYFLMTRANRGLLASQLFLATLIDSSPSGVLAADEQGKIMIFNRQASEQFGIDQDSALGRDIDTLFVGSGGNRFCRRSNGGPANGEVLCRRQDGSLFPAYVIASPIATRERHIVAHLFIIRDITESKRFQEMIVRLNRYYTRGEMAGEVAHEINNYLAVLSGNLELLPLFWARQDEEKFRQKLAVMKQTVDKIARFSEALPESDPDTAVFEMTDLNQLVQNTVSFLKPQNKFDKIEMTTSLRPDLPWVEVDAGQINQVLVNILTNSAEALKERDSPKRISVTISPAGAAPLLKVQIEIVDNGPGVLPDKEGLLFAKRFTTRRKGTGIGLITCRKIVEAHGGSIEYRFADGAVFRIELPLRQNHRELPFDATAESHDLVQPAEVFVGDAGAPA